MSGPLTHPALVDAERALSMFEAMDLGTCSDVMFMVTVPGAPWSKSRPRFARGGHAYAKPEDVDAETRTAAFLRSVVEKPLTGNVAVGCVFYRPNRQRIDADNLLKHVCDAANGVLWADDSQCTAIMGVVELDPDNPRTIIVIGEHASTMTRGSDAVYPCAVCGGPIAIVGPSARKSKVTCSRTCSSVAKGFTPLDEMVPCAVCSIPFRRATTAQTMCSHACRVESLRGKRRAMAQPSSACLTCSKPLDHRRGGRCRDCWRADPSGRLTAEREGRLW